MQFVRLVVFGFIALSVVYLSISLYSKSVRRERLEKEFDAEYRDTSDPEARAAYVAEGMVAYHNSIRPKLIGLVYLIPTVAISVIVYMVNTN